MEGIYKRWIYRYSHGKRKKTATTKPSKKSHSLCLHFQNKQINLERPF